jgi:uncharacterized membrane protein YqaE (UPF0057 family)
MPKIAFKLLVGTLLAIIFPPLSLALAIAFYEDKTQEERQATRERHAANPNAKDKNSLGGPMLWCILIVLMILGWIPGMLSRIFSLTHALNTQIERISFFDRCSTCDFLGLVDHFVDFRWYFCDICDLE